VTDTVAGVNPVLVDDDNSDGFLSPGEMWFYEATGVAQDLGLLSLGTQPDGEEIVLGCNPSGQPIPGERNTYMNTGMVEIPGSMDTDPSHYCNPPPDIAIQKTTDSPANENPIDSDFDNEDDPKGVGVPVIPVASAITWTYEVTNTGAVDIPLADITVTDSVDGVSPALIPDGNNADGILSPNEKWLYDAVGVALDLSLPADQLPVGVIRVMGCNPDQIPGRDRYTYMNTGYVVIPGSMDDDPSHYCNPLNPGIDIEKLTNGNQADDKNDADVPQLIPGNDVTWTYIVTNTGNVTFAEAEVAVNDDIVGIIGSGLITNQGDGDGFLSPGEVWTYTLTVPNGVQDLLNPDAGTIVVQGCNGGDVNAPGIRETYENLGTVTVPDASDSDPSHYCNPPNPAIDIEKLTNGNQADDKNDADVPELVPGANVTWTYIVTNTGNVTFAEAEVAVNDDIVGTIGSALITDKGDGDGFLSPGESWTYTLTVPNGVQDLQSPAPGTVVVQGCNGGDVNAP
ncbi:MAG: hypothetical protein GY788_23740, partial [bacterium]|nr:hypothetical protein [bacterium]